MGLIIARAACVCASVSVARCSLLAPIFLLFVRMRMDDTRSKLASLTRRPDQPASQPASS